MVGGDEICNCQGHALKLSKAESRSLNFFYPLQTLRPNFIVFFVFSLYSQQHLQTQVYVCGHFVSSVPEARDEYEMIPGQEMILLFFCYQS